MSIFDKAYAAALDALAARGLHRKLRDAEPLASGAMLRDGRRLINFSSNDYLGLSQHPALVARANEWSERYGTGSGASRLVTGNLHRYAEIEARIAREKGAEAALILGSGYLTNATLVPALLRPEAIGTRAIAYSDALNHSSIVHGLRAARLKPMVFRHNDLSHLEDLLRRDQAEKAHRFIFTESVFSMDGDCANIEALIMLAERYGCFLYVDEAHATGVLGPRGMGLCAAFPGKVDLVMGTFSKALGSYGAYVACSQTLRDYLINRMTGLIYSTALPPGVLGAIDAALDLVPGMDAERANLARSGERVRQVFKSAGLDCGLSTTQIIPLVLGDEERVMSFGASLEEQGVLGVPIRPPTVPQGTSRIRFALSAAHDEAAIDHLIGSVTELAAKQMAPA
ncbi:MAG TPA: 8-amino-7-oxononanoate synthase [Alphaproteobacteria bacterium]|nr:8-amino-7-oxononanoate synthase [Alphaproteobacteria bacterium]